MAPKAEEKKSPNSGGKKPKKGKKSGLSPDGTSAAIADAFHVVGSYLPTTSLTVYRTEGGHIGMTVCNHPLGVMLVEVTHQDLAYQTGFRKGDVLTSINGRHVMEHTLVIDLLAPLRPLNFEYIKAKVAEGEMLSRRRPAQLAVIDTKEGHLGLTMTSHPLGVLLADANDHDLAFKAGLRSGDVLVTINGNAVVDHRVAFDLLVETTSQGEPLHVTYHTAEAAAIELVVCSPAFFSKTFADPPSSSRAQTANAPPPGFSHTTRTHATGAPGAASPGAASPVDVADSANAPQKPAPQKPARNTFEIKISHVR